MLPQAPAGARRRVPATVCTFLLLTLTPQTALAQAGDSISNAAATTPIFWYVLASGLALLVPSGLVLVGIAGLDMHSAWTTALGALGAIGLALLSYWAFGFALQFGGVGLVYPQAGLRLLVWEWSPLPTAWGTGWGAAGLSGWFLSGADVTVLAYGLFLAHLPWVVASTMLVVMALRGRTPSLVTLLLALLMGGFVFPLAGNWVQGGGWLNSLGRNLNLGHGFVDFGGAGTVFLVAAAFSSSALVVWRDRSNLDVRERQLPTAQLPLLAVVGALLVMGGAVGWLWSNPLQVETLSLVGLMRGSLNIILSAAAGVLVPLLYSWFVSGVSHPTMSARGLVAGLVAGLAAGPFLQPGTAFLCGLLAGGTVPFVAHFVDVRLRLFDATGVLSSAGLPAMVGLIFVGIFADGAVGAGWQMTGRDAYLGVTGQGVSGLLTASGFSSDFPGQFQAQLIGIIALALWGFVTGMAVCVPLGLLTHYFERSARRQSLPRQNDARRTGSTQVQPDPNPLAQTSVTASLSESEPQFERPPQP